MQGVRTIPSTFVAIAHPFDSHPSVAISRVRHDDSTSNLIRHVRSCAPANTAESQAMETFAKGTTYSEIKHRVKIALWIACRHRPYVIAEDPELLDIFKMLHGSCVTPSRTTVSRDVQEIHEITKKVVMEILAVSKFELRTVQTTDMSCSLLRARYTSQQTDGAPPTSSLSLASLCITF